jgi:hypothetical protein
MPSFRQNELLVLDGAVLTLGRISFRAASGELRSLNCITDSLLGNANAATPLCVSREVRTQRLALQT